ncbi:hypothetical protein L2E82_16166 [Cichorium intybus]|uniref:Uncharacterized protein n=1 Tax=Cichorium intybus TaxID=13427 RepID=A0ACB9F591_CICIN|nr:hypothetical protein L2E82_16166 [Cichorium intybus]
MNAASFTVIAVAMKLPMDLNNSTPGHVDKAAKLGSVGFMCAMMANVLPALATMDNKELIANIIPLGVQILELKYQAARETALKDQELQRQGRLTVDKLKQDVRKYWIMAATGDPQLHVIVTMLIIRFLWDFKSDYKWSMLIIFIKRFIGSLLGTMAPLSRCFAALSFKLSMKWIWNNMKVLNVESYWTRTSSDLKESSIPFPSCSRKFKILFQNMEHPPSNSLRSEEIPSI